MSTILCAECGKRIIQKGEECPHCGEAIPQSNTTSQPSKGFKYEYIKDEKKKMEDTKEIEDEDTTMLISCKACGESISKNAVSCPHCGEPLQSNKHLPRSKITYEDITSGKKTSWWIWVALFLFISWILGESGIIGTKKSKNTSTSYSKPDKHKEELRKRLKGGYYACTSESLFDEMTSATVQKDNLAIGHLLASGCVLTKSGVRISYIGSSSFAVAKVRAYDGTDTVILYTNFENVYY